MSSRDPDNRSSRPQGTPAPEADQGTAPRSRFFDVDPAEIDRYLSGRPQRTQAERPSSRSRSSSASSDTVNQLQRLQEARGSRRRAAESPPEEAVEPDATEQQRLSAATRAARSPLRTNRRASYMQEDPYVSGLEEEPEAANATWNTSRRYEPEYPETYDDAETWEGPAPARTPRRPARPARQISRPNLQRPSLPPAIANADVVNDLPALIFIGMSTVGLAVMSILVANRIGSLDPVIPTHVSASGVLEHFATRETVWQLPLLTAMLTLMNIVAAWFISPLDRFASRFLLATGVVVQFVAWVAVLRILW